MKVMSINCQNNDVNRHGGAVRSGYDYSIMLANHIIDNEYDFVGTQEMSTLFTDKMTKNLLDYHLSGKYRNDFKILKIFFPKLQELKENNKIILKGKILYEKTFRLPWIPFHFKELLYVIKRKSIMRRIASGVLVDTNELGKVYVLNTHLDYASKELQKRQLKKLYKHIYQKRLKYPVIITGDFNMEISNKYFSDFIDKLEKINIKRVPINHKTNASKYRQKSAIDHIFIPSEYQIIDYGVVIDDNIKDVTDHLPIFVEFKK